LFVAEHLVEPAATLSRLAAPRARGGLPYLVGLNPGRAQEILTQPGLSDRTGLRFFFA
jgi:hypothetical protein